MLRYVRLEEIETVKCLFPYGEPFAAEAGLKGRELGLLVRESKAWDEIRAQDFLITLVRSTRRSRHGSEWLCAHVRNSR